MNHSITAKASALGVGTMLARLFARGNASLFTIAFVFFLFPSLLVAQNMSINNTGTTPDNSAMLDVQSTTQGVLIPRMTAAQRAAIVSPAQGLIVFQLDGNTGIWLYDTNTVGWTLMASNISSQDLDSVLAVGNNAGGDSILNLGGLAIGTNTLSSAPLLINGTGAYGAGIELRNGGDRFALTNSGNGLQVIKIDGSTFVAMHIDHPSGDVGIGTTAPIAKLDVEGTNVVAVIRDSTSWSALDIQAGTGEALIRLGNADGSINGGMRWDPTTESIHHFISGLPTPGMYQSKYGSISINSASIDTLQELFVYRDASLFDYGPGRTNIYAYRGGTSGATKGGTGWQQNQVDAALKGVSYWGNSFTAGVYGSNYGDYQNSAGVLGYMDGSSKWGVLAYRDTTGNTYGIYTPNEAYVGQLRVNGRYTLPMVDGTTNQALITNGSGTVAWGAPSIKTLQDTDGDTKIQVEESVDEDIIRFDMAGVEYFTMDSGRFNILNTGGSVFIGNSAGLNDDLTANNNTFVGTSAGQTNTSGQNNTFSGYSAGNSNTTGSNNTFSGFRAGISNTTASYNTFTGDDVGYSNTTGSSNTFSGDESGFSNTSGSYNSFYGDASGRSNTIAYYNTFSGSHAGYSNSTGASNTFIGYYSGYNNTTSNYSTFVGRGSGRLSTGTANTAIGYNAGENITTGTYNFFGGYLAGGSSTGITGSYNVGIGFLAASSMTTANSNVMVGYYAGTANTTGSYNIFQGSRAGEDNTTGSYNIFQGSSSGANNISGNYNVAIGYQSGNANTTGDYNAFSGYQSGYANTTGTGNVGYGLQTLYGNQKGAYNVAIGYRAGYGTTAHSKSNNVYIGYNAGYNDTTNYKLYIESSSDTATPLIWGDFATNRIGLFGNVGIGSKNSKVLSSWLGGRLGILNTSGNALVVEQQATGMFSGIFHSQQYGVIIESESSSSANYSLDISTGASANGGSGSSIFNVRNDGYVGIGTTSPTANVHLYGTGAKELKIQSTSASNATLTLQNTTNYWDLKNFAGELRIGLNGSDQMTIEASGEVGIGTVNPTSMLEVVGDVKIPTTNAYTYSTAKTQYRTISQAAFEIVTTGSGVYVYRPLTGGYAYIAYTKGGTYGVASNMVAQVNLPDGAVVTNLAVSVYDVDATYDCTATLVRQPYNSPSSSVMATIASSGTPGMTTVNTSTITNATIDMSSYVYYVQLSSVEAASGTGFYNVRITYTVTKTD